MAYKSCTRINALLTKTIAGLKLLILMSVAAAFFTSGFIIGMTRVVLGLHEEHRKFADLVKLAKDELGYMRIASGFAGPSTGEQEKMA